VRATVPVKELAGVMEMEEVLPVVAPGATLILPLLESVKLLLVFGGAQNPEQPTANATINGTDASISRRHFPVIIAVASLHFPFEHRPVQGSGPAKGSASLLKDIACVLVQEKHWSHAAEDRDAETYNSAHASD
jgi:hypothetical protein